MPVSFSQSKPPPSMSGFCHPMGTRKALSICLKSALDPDAPQISWQIYSLALKLAICIQVLVGFVFFGSFLCVRPR